MRVSGSLPGNIVKVGCVVAVLCTVAIAETASASPPPAKSATKKTASTSAPHNTSSATSRSVSAKSHKASGSTASHKGKKSRKSASRRGQQKIDSERARQIQEALVREHYLSGVPSSTWDAATEDALRKFQADNGWQNKTVPDSRALIKLGLGPSHDHLLNPESAMTTTPQAPRGTANTPSSTSSGPAPADTSTRPQQ